MIFIFATIILITAIFLIMFLLKNRSSSKNVAKIVKDSLVNIYNDDSKNVNNSNNLNKIDNQNTPQKSNVNFTALGDIMMGGEVGNNLNYMYINAFKKIYSVTSSADITFATLDSDITNVSKITDDTKSKYIVTKDAISAFQTLGIDGISVATEHMVDFTDDIFKNTVDILNKNQIYVSGLNNTPVYCDKNNQRIAVISANDVVIGTSTNYDRNNINIYNDDKMKQDIFNAKQHADFVIVNINWGRDYIYGVTDRMKQIAKNVIDYGANLVIGNNALGVYPIVEYNNVPIIYSLGYLISDLDYNLAKQSFIFTFDIDTNSKVKSITMIPIYVSQKQDVELYFDYNSIEASEYINQINTWNLQNGLNSSIINNNIIVNF